MPGDRNVLQNGKASVAWARIAPYQFGSEGTICIGRGEKQVLAYIENVLREKGGNSWKEEEYSHKRGKASTFCGVAWKEKTTG